MKSLTQYIIESLDKTNYIVNLQNNIDDYDLEMSMSVIKKYFKIKDLSDINNITDDEIDQVAKKVDRNDVDVEIYRIEDNLGSRKNLLNLFKQLEISESNQYLFILTVYTELAKLMIDRNKERIEKIWSKAR